MEYIVQWSIDVDAANPLDAALQAADAFRERGYDVSFTITQDRPERDPKYTTRIYRRFYVELAESRVSELAPEQEV